MKPEGKERYMYSNPYHWTELEISAEAADIIITALVLNHLSWLYDRHDNEELSAHFCQLMEYVKDHPEAAAIFCALN